MSNFRERTVAAARTSVINAITFKDFDIVHNVKVHEKLGEEGAIDYRDDSEEVNIKSVTLRKKKDDKGGFKYYMKITVES